MCGISGIISKKNLLDRKHIIRMNGMISHRGPDQSGYLEYKNIHLGHVRLSVIDISDNGRQPMSNDGRFWIVFNGEIYNYLEIKEELLQKNYKFYSKTDTEVILNAFKEWGIKCFERFNGDWVIAILDKKKNTFLIARDQIGSKPCYIYEDKYKIAFSSEIKGFMGLNHDLNFDERNLGISGQTLCSFSKTEFKNVNQLSPGRILTIDLETCKKNIHKWWYPLENLPKIHPNYEVNKSEYFELLYQATKLRLNADIKIGTSLSGGLDSSVIFTILNLINLDDKGFNEKEVDLNPTIMNYENCRTYEEAVKLANHYKRKYKLISSNELNLHKISNIFSKLEIDLEYFRQPILYEKQKELGIHVSIDGHGADEFLGMPPSLLYYASQTLNQITNINTANFFFGNDATKKQISELLGQLSKSRRMIKINYDSMLDLNNPLKRYTKSNNFSGDKMIVEDDIDTLNNYDISTQFTFFQTHCGWMQWFLGKWDRASMSSAVEVRSPFLDKNLILYSLALPFDKKVKNGKLKSILRDSMEKHLPAYIVNQNFKQGLPLMKKIDFFSSSNISFMENIINEKDFTENLLWDSKLAKRDFYHIKNNNLDFTYTWKLMKYYLMLKGFREKYYDVIKNYDLNFYPSNNLSKISF